MIKRSTTIKTLKSIVAIVAVISLTASHSIAGDLKPSFELESTKTLPKNVRNPRFKFVTMSIEDRFDSSGNAVTLGSKLNKRVSWSDVLKAQESDEQRSQVQSMIESAGLDVNGSPGNTSGVVNTAVNVLVPVLGWGITENWTAAVAVPVYRIDASVSTGFLASEDGQKFVDQVGTESSAIKANEAAAKLNNAIPQKLARLGYDPVQSETVKAIGDIKLVNKYKVLDDGYNAVSVKGDVTFPTGKGPNMNKAVDLTTGDGQWDVGAQVGYDRTIPVSSLDLRLNGYAGYVWQINDSIERRIPTAEGDSLSSDKEVVSRNLGDQIQMGSSVNADLFGTGFNLGVGYIYQFQTRTTYAGTLYGAERYTWLENEQPVQSLHSMTAQVGFSTVEFYKAKKFVLPFQINGTYSRPLLGRNVTKNEMVMGEMVMFF